MHISPLRDAFPDHDYLPLSPIRLKWAFLLATMPTSSLTVLRTLRSYDGTVWYKMLLVSSLLLVFFLHPFSSSFQLLQFFPSTQHEDSFIPHRLTFGFPIISIRIPILPIEKRCKWHGYGLGQCQFPPLLLRTTNVRFVEQPEGND